MNTERGSADYPGTETRPTTSASRAQQRALRTVVVANTAVDPVRRAALPKSLRHSRMVDEPSVIEVYAMLEGELMATDRTLLATWRPHIGRDRTRGGGNARLRTLGYRVYDLNQSADLHAWIQTTGPDRFEALTPIPLATATVQAVIDSEFAITAALHVGTGGRRGKNAAIRTRGNESLLPASTWKDVFRARASYIARSCWGDDAVCRSQGGCGQCPICDLFGSATKRGRLAFRDSVITGARRRERHHVATDRVSGGGQDKLLFTDDVVTSGRVKLTINALAPVAEWERNLLRHVMHDLHDGLIGIGGGAQRGQGNLQLTDASDPALTTLEPIPTQLPNCRAS